jgi:hypothetical protein
VQETYGWTTQHEAQPSLHEVMERAQRQRPDIHALERQAKFDRRIGPTRGEDRDRQLA